MRLILRILGTWFIGMAVILAVIDGIKSLGADTLVTTGLGETWASLNGGSLEQVRSFIDSRFFGPVLEPLLSAALNAPGFIVLAVPGIALVVLGRARTQRRFVKQDQF